MQSRIMISLWEGAQREKLKLLSWDPCQKGRMVCIRGFRARKEGSTYCFAILVVAISPVGNLLDAFLRALSRDRKPHHTDFA
jgi:hypothetical protein